LWAVAALVEIELLPQMELVEEVAAAQQFMWVL
jgi:hypothetical protein